MPISSLILDISDNGQSTYELANSINNQYHIHGNIASNDGYIASMYLSYLWSSHYYGTSLENWNSPSNTQLENDLQEYNIDYYLVWGDTNNTQVLSQYHEITNGKITGLKIYDIKEKNS